MQKENVRAMENLTTNLTQLINQLRRDWSSSGSRSRDNVRRGRNHHCWQRGVRCDEAARDNDSCSHRDEKSRGRSDDDKDQSKVEWNWNRRPRRVELGWKMDLPIFSGDDAYGGLCEWNVIFGWLRLFRVTDLIWRWWL